jgi:hypothetical protein
MANTRSVADKNYSIVLLGKFFPPTFQPSWLAAKKLIREGEAEKADVKIVHQSLTQFSLPWGNIQVEPEKFAITMNDTAGVELARQLAVGIFTTLSKVPVSALGINQHVHFGVEDAKVWHEIGHKLIPKQAIWEKILKKPGTKSLLVEGEHEDGTPGSIRIRVEPSVVIANGIYVDINDHFVIGEGGKAGTAADAVKVLTEKAKGSDANSERIIDHLMKNL